jgi:hypothetical protein
LRFEKIKLKSEIETNAIITFWLAQDQEMREDVFILFFAAKTETGDFKHASFRLKVPSSR